MLILQNGNDNPIWSWNDSGAIDSTQAQGNNYFAGSHITATKYSFAYISEVAANQNQLNEKQLSEIIKSL